MGPMKRGRVPEVPSGVGPDARAFPTGQTLPVDGEVTVI
jgi:hypothetical protein